MTYLRIALSENRRNFRANALSLSDGKEKDR
jgi:hypothetical protein